MPCHFASGNKNIKRIATLFILLRLHHPKTKTRTTCGLGRLKLCLLGIVWLNYCRPCGSSLISEACVAIFKRLLSFREGIGGRPSHVHLAYLKAGFHLKWKNQASLNKHLQCGAWVMANANDSFPLCLKCNLHFCYYTLMREPCVAGVRKNLDCRDRIIRLYTV